MADQPTSALWRAPGPLQAQSDLRLAQLASTGDDAAFGALYERYRGENGAGGAAQSSTVRSLPARARAWLARIAGRRESESAAEVRAELRHRLRRILAELPELTHQQRAAIVLSSISGLSHQEVATTLGIPVADAKQALVEARRTLARIERGQSPGCAEVRGLIGIGDQKALRRRWVRAHLRGCDACGAFAQEMRTGLRVQEMLPAPLAAALARLLDGGAGASMAGGSAAVAGSAASGALAPQVATVIATYVVTTTGMTVLQDTVSPEPRPGPRVTHTAASDAAATAQHTRAPTAVDRVDGTRPGEAVRAARRAPAAGTSPTAPGGGDLGGDAAAPAAVAITGEHSGHLPAGSTGSHQPASQPSETGTPQAQAPATSSRPSEGETATASQPGGSDAAGDRAPNDGGGQPPGAGEKPAGGGRPDAPGANPPAAGGNPGGGNRPDDSTNDPPPAQGNGDPGGGNANGQGGNPGAASGGANASGGGNPSANANSDKPSASGSGGKPEGNAIGGKPTGNTGGGNPSGNGDGAPGGARPSLD